jgi:hypothetical protein
MLRRSVGHWSLAYLAHGHQVRVTAHAARVGVQGKVIYHGDLDGSDAGGYKSRSRTTTLGHIDSLAEMPAKLKF